MPLGMLTMFAGDPKLGQSFVTLAVAAVLSRGLALPQSNLPSRPVGARDRCRTDFIPFLRSIETNRTQTE